MINVYKNFLSCRYTYAGRTEVPDKIQLLIILCSETKSSQESRLHLWVCTRPGGTLSYRTRSIDDQNLNKEKLTPHNLVSHDDIKW